MVGLECVVFVIRLADTLFSFTGRLKRRRVLPFTAVALTVVDLLGHLPMERRRSTAVDIAVTGEKLAA